MNIDEILLEWSYRLPKGYPTIVDGVFTEYEEVKILNEIMEEKGFGKNLPVQEAKVISAQSINTNDTNVKEALVMVFYDCLRSNSNFKQTYAKLLQQPADKDIDELVSVLDKSKSLNSDYGFKDIDSLHNFIVQELSNLNKNKSKAFKLINNTFSAANTIATNEKITRYTGGKKYATRGTVFNSIRKDAVNFFRDIKVNLNFPDNWCPGDFYLMAETNKPTAANIVELNSKFAGPSYPEGEIVAVSLKMEDAQAGKGTTFINTVLSVSDIDKSKTTPTNLNSKLGTKYLEAKRLIRKYAIDQESFDLNKINTKLGRPFKLLYDLTKKKNEIPTINKFAQFGNSKEERAKQLQFIKKNYRKMGSEASIILPTLDKEVLSNKNVKAYSEGFEQAYTEFKTFIRSIGIKNVQSAGAKEFVKMIITGKGAAKEGGPAKILIKKTECYTRAIELIQKWSDKNKAIAKPFEKLGTVDNPLLAITMFAIAQHGANPDFFKVHGSDTGLTGTLELFPAKSKVDNESMVQSVEIVDSENAAGFNVKYRMKLNNVTYSTVLTFRFSQSQFRVEVQELEVES